MEHEGKEYMVHADIEDEGQTVRVVDIHTTATNPETGDTLGSASEELELVDAVAYENLTPGSPYRLTATLYDSETGSEIVDSEGKVVTAEGEFTPGEENGIAEVHGPSRRGGSQDTRSCSSRGSQMSRGQHHRNACGLRGRRAIDPFRGHPHDRRRRR